MDLLKASSGIRSLLRLESAIVATMGRSMDCHDDVDDNDDVDEIANPIGPKNREFSCSLFGLFVCVCVQCNLKVLKIIQCRDETNEDCSNPEAVRNNQK